ncbi:hypothetical protein [Octadecabacter antarcticus]|nr:hypothetical protein [Octadecabacter antarcticus]
MEVTFRSSKTPDHRPDGLVACKRGTSEWTAFIEAKAGKSEIRSEQIQDYAHLASLLDVHCIISISNEFARSPTELPYHVAGNKRRKKEIRHFAWAELRASIDRFSGCNELPDLARNILSDAASFLWDPASGILTFDQMPQEWGEFVQSSGVGVGFSSKTPGITEIVHGWHQERRDLRSKLAHEACQAVELRHELGMRAEFDAILSHDRKRLAEKYELVASFVFKEPKLSLDVRCELQDRKSTVSVDIPVPADKGAKAATTWLTKQTEDFEATKTDVIMTWKGRGNGRHVTLETLRNDPDKLFEGMREAPKSIRLVRQIHDVRRFRSAKNFIVDLELLVLHLTNELRRGGFI